MLCWQLLTVQLAGHASLLALSAECVSASQCSRACVGGCAHHSDSGLHHHNERIQATEASTSHVYLQTRTHGSLHTHAISSLAFCCCAVARVLFSAAPTHNTHAHSFVPRHNSTTPAELQEMVAETGFNSMDDLITATVPAAIMCVCMQWVATACVLYESSVCVCLR